MTGPIAIADRTRAVVALTPRTSRSLHSFHKSTGTIVMPTNALYARVLGK